MFKSDRTGEYNTKTQEDFYEKNDIYMGLVLPIHGEMKSCLHAVFL